MHLNGKNDRCMKISKSTCVRVDMEGWNVSADAGKIFGRQIFYELSTPGILIALLSTPNVNISAVKHLTQY